MSIPYSDALNVYLKFTMQSKVNALCRVFQIALKIWMTPRQLSCFSVSMACGKVFLKLDVIHIDVSQFRQKEFDHHIVIVNTHKIVPQCHKPATLMRSSDDNFIVSPSRWKLSSSINIRLIYTSLAHNERWRVTFFFRW